jgi:hypothetical protein
MIARNLVHSAIHAGYMALFERQPICSTIFPAHPN